ncbi:uncharacterized protein LY89DRAFT_214223 [Mollisia scopiformis]|uniref:Zn(2)-C6 fungal-type domain-containing protein n=1 Tax=Mollisia scopiformis TaxID=149040 RepID=A0A194WV63_MOLSC|nr:uncharacterized protein LY89DRAFT_214223 [Mollisia scopiformis]KUJ11858.1 hypothetical protein LY89DRAFT_214223 [Mollisia scopiformis]
MDKSAANSTKPQRKPGRKQRIPLSCEPCRSRKLKCDRKQPCQNCSVRDNPKGCLFLGPEGGPATSLKPMQVEGMQSRIDRLEQLVTTLVAQGHDPNGSIGSSDNSGNSEASIPEYDSSAFRAPSAPERHTPPYEEIEHGGGVMKVDGNASMYKGATHWYDVLQELNEIKSFWSQVQENPTLGLEPSYSDAIDGPSLFFGVGQPTTLPELLSSLPSRPAVEKLLTRFFDNEEGPAPTFHILHKPTFMRQYREHLAAPDKTPIMWLGLFFAVLSQIMLSYNLSGDEPPEYEGISASLSQLYRVKAAQSLAMGDISTCKPYTVETLIYSIMCEWGRNGQGDARVWLMVGILVRVALQMGYHRDPSQYPEITVFQGEMRRRVWCFVHRTDSLTAFLCGQTCSIRELSHDTRQPANLYDWELSEDMTELPPSRPIIEPTPVSYLIVKGNILLVLGKVVNLLNDLGHYPYDRILELDTELERTFQDTPAYWKLQDFNDVDNESPSLVNRRIQLDFLYNQGMCVLHRKFFAQGRLDARFERSYTRCRDSAIALLAQQHFLFTQAQVKGSLIARHWYRVSYTSHSFILATMILVLDIRHRRAEARAKDIFIKCTLEANACMALQNACVIWKQKADEKDSAEAVKVYQVLSNMLNTLGFGEYAAMPGTKQVVIVPELAQPEDIYNPGISFAPPLDMDIDWDVWDSYVEGTSFDDAYGNPQNFELV